MNELSVVSVQHVTTVPAALKALAAMRAELSHAKTYTEIRKIVDAAEAIKLLGRDIDVVKVEAEDTILQASARIGEELERVPKAVHRGGPKKQSPQAGKSLGRESAMPSHTTRARYTTLAKHKGDLKSVAEKLRAKGKDATPRAVATALTQGDKKERRTAREKALADKQRMLPTALYGVIYADPPWRFEPYSRDTGMDRAADNHYPTLTVDDIKALPVPAADDCALFLWATVPMLPQALEVMTSWGFTYKSHFVWVKPQIGTGYWNRNRHELLLIGTRGNIPAPAHGEQYASVIEADNPQHSAKPFHFREIIEDTFPNLPRVELFARRQWTGWDTWGNEVGEVAA